MPSHRPIQRQGETAKPATKTVQTKPSQKAARRRDQVFLIGHGEGRSRPPNFTLGWSRTPPAPAQPTLLAVTPTPPRASMRPPPRPLPSGRVPFPVPRTQWRPELPPPVPAPGAPPGPRTKEGARAPSRRAPGAPARPAARRPPGPGTHPETAPGPLTFSMVPGSRRSSSRHRTTPSLSDACKKTSGSEMVFFGDSSTPRVMSHVTVCSAEFIAAAARAARTEGAPRAITSERPGPRPPAPPPPPRPWAAARRRLARPAQQVPLGSAGSRAPWPAVKCLFISGAGTCGRPAPPPAAAPRPRPPSPDDITGEERRGGRPRAPRASPGARQLARPPLTCAARAPRGCAPLWVGRRAISKRFPECSLEPARRLRGAGVSPPPRQPAVTARTCSLNLGPDGSRSGRSEPRARGRGAERLAARPPAGGGGGEGGSGGRPQQPETLRDSA